MIGERSIFLNLKLLEVGAVAFGGIGKEKITSIGKIGIPFVASVDNLLYVEGMKCNLLSLSQFCDHDYIMSFNKEKCIVKTKYDNSFFIIKQHNNLYEIDLIDLRK